MKCHRSSYLNLMNSELSFQIEEAKENLHIARQEAMYADASHLDLANEKVCIAMAYLNLLFKQAKLNQ